MSPQLVATLLLVAILLVAELGHRKKEAPRREALKNVRESSAQLAKCASKMKVRKA